jgi:hypothetical protein
MRLAKADDDNFIFSMRIRLLVTIFPITYYFTHATPDYREPIEPEVVVLVVMGILSLTSREEPLVMLDAAMEEEESQMSMSMSGLGSALNEEASF